MPSSPITYTYMCRKWQGLGERGGCLHQVAEVLAEEWSPQLFGGLGKGLIKREEGILGFGC